MDETVSQQALDECAAEQIHLAGAIRPSGCLLVIDPADFSIQFISANVAAIVATPAEELLGAPLADHIPEKLFRRIKHDVETLDPNRRITHRYQWPQLMHPRATLLWRVPDKRFVALEIILADDAVAEITDRVYRTIDWAALDAEKNLDRLMQTTANMLRSLTEYDRVMVYRFHEDGSGFVQAEARREDLESFLGIYYPGADILPQARDLFIKNRVRIIDDVQYDPVPLIGHKAKAASLDLSPSLLRSVSPIHTQYLLNMGVRGSLAISLVHRGKLWGMVACHHYSPKVMPPALLAATELVSQMLSVLCERTERYEEAEKAEKSLEKVISVLRDVSGDALGILPSINNNLDAICEAVAADGIALVDMENRNYHGDVPDEEAIDALCYWLEQNFEEDVFSTDHLGQVWPDAEKHNLTKPGVLALRWSGSRRSWILWFRNEWVETVTWAGNPEKAVQRDPHGRLTPRGSFEAWKSDIRGLSRPWTSGELAAIQPLKRLSSLDDLSEAAKVERTAQGHFLGSVHDPVIIVDLQGRIVECNKTAEEKFFLQNTEGKHLHTLVKIASEAQLPLLLEQAASGQVWVGEYERTSNPPAFYEVALMPVPVEGAKVRTVAIALRDITERRILEEQLSQAQKLEALGQLTGGVAHNFNNLLTVILGSADMIIAQVEDNNPIMDDLLLLRSACEDAGQIVSDLMSFARQDRSESENIDVGALIRQLASLLQRTIRSQIQLALNLPSTPLLINADPGQLEQVLMNLVINARDAIEGTGEISISVFSRHFNTTEAREFEIAEGSYVVIKVTDNGSGVAPENLGRIFDPFFTTKSASEGTGLGLSSSFGIIKKHGGKLAVVSELGKGSAFSVFLPSVGEQAEPTRVKPGQLNILLVDDEMKMRQMMSRLLTMWGHSVREAEDGVEALEIIESDREDSVDLIITDQLMPKMIGSELIEKVRQDHKNLPIILMSGYTDREWPLDDELQRTIRKPFDSETIRALIKELVDRAKEIKRKQG